MPVKKPPTAQAQIESIIRRARVLEKVIPDLPPKDRAKAEARIAKAWAALQPSDWSDSLISDEIIRWLKRYGTAFDRRLANGEAQSAVEKDLHRRALDAVASTLAGHDAAPPRLEMAVKGMDSALVLQCLHAWRPSLFPKRGAPTKGTAVPKRHALTARLLSSLQIPTTEAAIRLKARRAAK